MTTPDSRSLLRRGERHPLAEYAKDYRAEDYWTLLRKATTAEGAPDTYAATARFLGCGREHAKTVAINLERHSLVRLVWNAERREYRLRATKAGLEALNV